MGTSAVVGVGVRVGPPAVGAGPLVGVGVRVGPPAVGVGPLVGVGVDEVDTNAEVIVTVAGTVVDTKFNTFSLV